jgi:peptidylprolyl isomerase/FKBP-type peptidyl-prolyl cis-trans isomerase FklB
MRIAATALAVLVLAAGGGALAQSDGQTAAAFMAQNAKADGVQVLPSGVEYKVIKAGPGTSRHPTPQDYVKVAYEGALLNGQVFDSTMQNPDPPMYQLKTLIPGWIDAVQHMQEGDEWMVWVPPALGYGPRAVGKIPANSVLVFRMKLVSILGG